MIWDLSDSTRDVCQGIMFTCDGAENRHHPESVQVERLRTNTTLGSFER